MKILDNALQLARERTGERYPDTMTLRTARFLETLRTAPSLIVYVIDLSRSAPCYPYYKPTYNGVVVELSEVAYERAA